MIKIGVSAAFMYPDPDRTYFGKKTLACLEDDMAAYLARPGVMPILIPDLPLPLLEAYLAEMDGFVFQGGSDIAPETYGATPIQAGRWPGDPERDAYERRILDYAIAHSKPIFGICRGCQLINVYFGGTLYQDLFTEKPDSLSHRDANLYDKVHHRVAFTPGGLLDRLYSGTVEPRINSVHHQGIRTLGTGLRVEATSPDDGLIEAVVRDSADHPFVLGVQWHPEFSQTIGDQVISPDPLYDLFLERVRQCQKHSQS